MYKYFSKDILFYILFSLSIVIIFFSNPFLRVPYDMWYHLERVNYYSIHHFNILEIKNKELWGYLWGSLFSTIEIDNILVRAKIIHITQSLISFSIIYYTSKVFLRNLFKNISAINLKYLSLWSVLIWFTIYATFSVHFHQVWIMWYSVNYQITLLFFWYIVALTLTILLEQKNKIFIIFNIFQILFFSIVILWMHAIEFIYVSMYILLLCLIYIKEIFYVLKQYYIKSLLAITLILSSFYYFITSDFLYRKPPLFYYLNLEHINELYTKLISLGNEATNHLSRSSASLNELMYISIILISIMGITLLFTYYKRTLHFINIKIFLLIFFSSLFIFIPINIISSGIASLLIAPGYINRFYYASSIFIVIPTVIYYFFQNRPTEVINSIILVTLLSTLFYSKYLSSSHNYYKNIHSIIESYKNKHIGFNLTDKQIEIIGIKIDEYKLNNITNKPNYYYARDDIALVIKFIYNQPTLWTERGNSNYLKNYQQHNMNSTYNAILFDTPKKFPPYIRYK